MVNLNTEIQIYGTAPGSIVDGPGIRYGIFFQGCSHHCPDCHNPKSQPHSGGRQMTVQQILDEFDVQDSCAGVTLSGGEPFEQAEAAAELAQAFKEKGTNVWVYSGYLFDDLIAIAGGQNTEGETKYCNKDHAQGVLKLLNNIDVLVDGPFIKEKKSYDALFRGSTNQRLIDIPKTLESGQIVEWKQEFKVPDRPSS